MLEGKTHISIIIPVFNEEKIIANTLTKLTSYISKNRIPCEILVCDDASSDSTPQIVKKFKDQNVRCIRFSRRVGKGGTIRNCWRIAKGDVLVFIDADLPFDVDTIFKVAELSYKTGKIVIGVRNVDSRKNQRPIRRFLSYVYNSLVRLMFKTGINDHQCGLKAIPRKYALGPLQMIRTDGFLFDTELIVRAKINKIKIIPVGINWVDPRPRKSKIVPSRTALTMLLDLIVVKLSTIFGRGVLKFRIVKRGHMKCLNDGTRYPVYGIEIDSNSNILKTARHIYIMMAFGG